MGGVAIARAWADAGVEADDVDWVVAHGTGTPVGDEIELRSLLSRLGPGERTCLLTSNKQVFGHTGVLAGLVSVAHALVALERGAVPGQPVVTDPHPLLGDGERLTVPVKDAPWPADGARPRVVGVSSFGLGGADAHVVLSDHVPRSVPRGGGASTYATTGRTWSSWAGTPTFPVWSPIRCRLAPRRRAAPGARFPARRTPCPPHVTCASRR